MRRVIFTTGVAAILAGALHARQPEPTIPIPTGAPVPVERPFIPPPPDRTDAVSEALRILAREWGGASRREARYDERAGKVLTEIDYTLLACGGKAYFFIGGADVVSDFHEAEGGPLAGGVYKAPGGATLRWTCHTHDGMTCKVAVGGRRYDLRDGAAFWVFHKGGRWEVHQTKVDSKVMQDQLKSETVGVAIRMLKATAKGNPALTAYATAIKMKVE